jgi:hypothetical protein
MLLATNKGTGPMALKPLRFDTHTIGNMKIRQMIAKRRAAGGESGSSMPENAIANPRKEANVLITKCRMVNPTKKRRRMPCRLTPQFSGRVTTRPARRERIMK